MNTQRMCLVWMSLSLLGCIGTDFGDDLAEGASEESSCMAAELLANVGSSFADVRSGEDGRVQMVGLCSAFEACTEDSPLMLGTEHDVLLEALVSDAEAVSFASTDAQVLSAANNGAVCRFAEGTLSANTVGTTVLTVSIAGAPADRFVLAVSAPHGFELSAPDALDDAMPVLAPGEATLLQATVTDVDGRVLAAGSAIEWTVEDDGVLEPAGDDPRGGALFVKARAPGTTTVHARVGVLEAALVVTVTP